VIGVIEELREKTRHIISQRVLGFCDNVSLSLESVSFHLYTMLKNRKRTNNGKIGTTSLLTKKSFSKSRKLLPFLLVNVGAFALWAIIDARKVAVQHSKDLDGIIIDARKVPIEAGYEDLHAGINNATDQKGRDNKRLTSGWDSNGLELYHSKQAEMDGRENHNISLAGGDKVTVSEVVNNNPNFWSIVDGRRGWERKTFEIFEKYVTEETIVVDFGTWIGPTLLFHGQKSRASYGIEADPAAFAVAERNVWLNKDKDWAQSVSVHSFCVGSTEHAGKIMTMRGAKAPGASMSGITEALARKPVGSWAVRCYTLPTILDSWDVVLSRQPVMLKIDVESYECQLVPSFYDWLVGEERASLPVIYVSFHPQIKDCSPEEWARVLKVFQLYDSVYCRGGDSPMQISKETTFEEFEEMKTNLSWKKDSTFVLVNN